MLDTTNHPDLDADAKAKLLETISNSPVTLTMNGELDDEDGIRLNASLPGDCIFGIEISRHLDPNHIVAFSDWLRVPSDLRGHHIGERLVRTSTVAAKEAGATILRGIIQNEAALRIRARVFGEANLRFFDIGEDDEIDGEPRELHITYQEAYDELQKAGLTEKDPENRQFGFMVDVNLEDIDTTGWERANLTKLY